MLDFEKNIAAADDSDPAVDLVRGDVEIQRSPLSGGGTFGCAIMIRVDNVDILFKKFVERGLDTTRRELSSPLWTSEPDLGNPDF